MNICIIDRFLVLYAEQQFNKLLAWRNVYSESRLIVFRSAWEVFRKIFPLCYKQVIALSPRKIKDKFSLDFQSFHKLPEWRDSGNFVKTLKIRVKIYP